MKALAVLTKPGKKDEIKFYNRDEPYYEFTNFYYAPIEIDGKRWPTTEHYFQAQKFVGTPYVEKIRLLPSAREAFQISRNPTVSYWRRTDWDAAKDDVMYRALCCKFLQHDTLRKSLLGTGRKTLIEHTSNDSYWGDGGDGRGQNKLGRLLMRVREELGKGGHEETRPSLKRSVSFSTSPVKREDALYPATPRDDSSLRYESSRQLSRPLRRTFSLTNLKASSVDHPSSHTFAGSGHTTGGARDSLHTPTTHSSSTFKWDRYQNPMSHPSMRTSTRTPPRDDRHLYRSPLHPSNKHTPPTRSPTSTFHGQMVTGALSGARSRSTNPMPPSNDKYARGSGHNRDYDIISHLSIRSKSKITIV